MFDQLQEFVNKGRYSWRVRTPFTKVRDISLLSLVSSGIFFFSRGARGGDFIRKVSKTYCLVLTVTGIGVYAMEVKRLQEREEHYKLQENES